MLNWFPKKENKTNNKPPVLNPNSDIANPLFCSDENKKIESNHEYTTQKIHNTITDVIKDGFNEKSFLTVPLDWFDSVNVSGDGHCLFHALGTIEKLIDPNKASKNIGEIRKKIYDELIKLRDKEKDDDPKREIQLEINQIEGKNTVNNWGGVLSIKAFASLHKICIYVYSESTKTWSLVTEDNNNTDRIDTCDNIYFLYHTGDHYDNLFPKDDTANLLKEKKDIIDAIKKVNARQDNNVVFTKIDKNKKDTIIDAINLFQGFVLDAIQGIYKAYRDFEHEYNAALARIYEGLPVIEKGKGNEINKILGQIETIYKSTYDGNANVQTINYNTDEIKKIIVNINNIIAGSPPVVVGNVVAPVVGNVVAPVVSNVAGNTIVTSVVPSSSRKTTSASTYEPKRFKSTDNVGSTLEDKSGKTFFIHPVSTRYNNFDSFTGPAAVYSFGNPPTHEQKDVTANKTGGKSKKRGRRKKDLAKTRKRKTPRKQKGGTIKPYTDFGNAFKDLKDMLNEKDKLVSKDIVDLLTLSQKCDALREFFSNDNNYKEDEVIEQNFDDGDTITTDNTAEEAGTNVIPEINHLAPGYNDDEFLSDSNDE